jgi:hypothetical protein
MSMNETKEFGNGFVPLTCMITAHKVNQTDIMSHKVNQSDIILATFDSDNVLHHRSQQTISAT